MKKMLIILLILALLLTACGKKEASPVSSTLQEMGVTAKSGKNETSVFESGEEPKNGEVFLDASLERSLRETEEQNAEFTVRVYVHCGMREFLYKGKLLKFYADVPVLREYNEASAKWYNEEYYELDREMTKAEEAGEEYAQGWWKHSVEEVFYEIWAAEQTEEKTAEYLAASKLYTEALNAYHEWNNNRGANRSEERMVQEEFARLRELRYELKQKEGQEYSAAGILTKEQIENFDADPSLGYWIAWEEEPTENKADTKGKEIVNRRDQGDVYVDAVAGAGEKNISGGVSKAMREESEDSLLDVSFYITDMSTALFRYDGMSMSQYEMNKSEQMEKYWELESEWNEEHREKMEYLDAEYWMLQEKGEEGKAAVDFMRDYNEAYNQSEFWYGGGLCERAMEEEFRRLEQLGYPIVRSEYGFSALLTPEQLKNFPYDPHYGYHVQWNEHNEKK